MCICNVAHPTDLLLVWYALAKEKQGTPGICIQVACNTMTKNLGLELPIITHHVANMVCDVAFVAHNCDGLLSGSSPFLFPTLASTEAQRLLDDLCV